MPEVNCPKCGRMIPVDSSELCNLFECARCGTRFYPMMPADDSPPARPPVPASATGGPQLSPSLRQLLQQAAQTPEVSDDPQTLPPTDPSRRPKKRRRRKKEFDWIPIIIALVIVFIVISGLSILGIVLYKVGAFQPTGSGAG